uniref:Uncharacterized protein n=1 Tax=Arundo donax TaxID=35708 RepID=A0A0A9FR34_ARUDO
MIQHDSERYLLSIYVNNVTWYTPSKTTCHSKNLGPTHSKSIGCQNASPDFQRPLKSLVPVKEKQIIAISKVDQFCRGASQCLAQS